MKMTLAIMNILIGREKSVHVRYRHKHHKPDYMVYELDTKRRTLRQGMLVAN